MGDLKTTIGRAMAPVMTGKQIMFVMAGVSDHFQRLAGIKSEVMFSDADVNTEIACLAAEYLGMTPAFSWDTYNFEARALGQGVVTAEYGLPDIDYSNPIIRSEADLDKLHWPTENPLDAGNYPLLFKQAELANKYFGYTIRVFSQAVSSFTLACELCGFSGFMAMIKRKPDLANEIMRRIVDDIHTPLVKAVAERFPGIRIMFADAWEMIPNLSPKVQKEFVWKYYDRLLENTKDMNAHLCWYMTYGESCMPDPEAYLLAKSKYSYQITCANTENMPYDLYVSAAKKGGLNLNVQIPADVIMDGPEEAIIEYTRKVAKEMRCQVDKFSWMALCPASAPTSHIRAVMAAGNAFSVLPCPTEEEIDAIQVTVPPETETFEAFCRRKAVENPEGYTFKWLDQAKFIG